MGSCFSSDFAAYADLEFAISLGHCSQTVELRLRRIKDINAVLPISRMTALELAGYKRRSSIESLLLARGARRARGTQDSNAQRTPSLMAACERGFLDAVRQATERGAHINAETQNGETPVFIATKNSLMGPLRMLLESGADPNTRTNNGSFALYEAVRQRNVEATQLLLMHGAGSRMLGPDGITILGVAINRKDLPITKLLLDHGADIEQKCDVQWTPLMTACSRGFGGGVKVLIKRGANISVRSRDGLTSLLLAAKMGHSSIVCHILDKDSSRLTDTAPNGYNALHYITLFGDSQNVRRLIDRGAGINAQTQDGETPGFIATKMSWTSCLRVLLEAGADPNIPTKDGNCAIHEAVNRNRTESVRMLLEHGADRTKSGKHGMTRIQGALNLAISNPAIVESLLNDHMVQRIEEGAPLARKLGEEEMNKLGQEVKECICCPITFEVMRDPVMAADGHTYERKAIQQWLRQKQESPVTRQPLPSSALTPNLVVRHLINQYMSISEGQ